MPQVREYLKKSDDLRVRFNTVLPVTSSRASTRLMTNTEKPIKWEAAQGSIIYQNCTLKIMPQ